MDFAFTVDDEAFRAELSEWLDGELPRFLAGWAAHSDDEAAEEDFDRTQARRRDWQQRLDGGRWAAINWPKEWHGREATPVQNAIHAEEMARVRCPGSAISQLIAELAVDLLGPAGLIGRGSPEAVDNGKWARSHSWQRSTSIGAGATEIQKNIIAKKAIRQAPRS